MTEAIYTHNTYHIVYDSRQKMPPLWARMGTEGRQDPGDLSEMQIPVLEQTPPECQKVTKCICQYCGKDFVVCNAETKRGGGKFCSKFCFYESMKGKPRPREIILKMRRGLIGHQIWNKGIPRTPEDKEKIRIKTREAMHRPEIYSKIIGKNHPNWRGGLSFEPYCIKFNDDFKERVRAFFEYKCVNCGEIQNGERLHVHHVNFRKDACCSNEVIPLFVSLCRSCHGKTGHNRPYWEQHFTEIINRDYGGHCYLPKEERCLTS